MSPVEHHLLIFLRYITLLHLQSKPYFYRRNIAKFFLIVQPKHKKEQPSIFKSRDLKTFAYITQIRV